MKRSKYNSFNELPLMLTVQDVADVLGIGLAHAYEVAHRQDFPTITLGSRIIVPRDKFMAWIDEQAAKKTEIFCKRQFNQRLVCEERLCQTIRVWNSTQ